MSEQQTALIVGATSGIGYAVVQALFTKPELTASYLKPDFRLVVTARNENSAAPLRELQQTLNVGDRFLIEYVDCDTQENIAAFTKNFVEKYPALDFFFYNAGIVTDDYSITPNTPLDLAAFNKCNFVNALAPAHMLAQLEPLLTKTFVARGGEIKKDAKSYTAADTKVRAVFTSSMMSTMKHHAMPWAPMYCASKAQMNHLMKHYAMLWPHLCIDLIHPGYIKTRLAPGGMDTPEASAEGILKVIGAESAIPTACQQLLWYNGEKTDF